jgi:hypothetical protein
VASVNYPQYPQQSLVASVTRTYDYERDYQGDAQAMAQAGWAVVAFGSRGKGLSGGTLVGILAAVAVLSVCAFCALLPIGIGFIVGPAVFVAGVIIVLVLAFQANTEITVTYAPAQRQ